MIHDQTPFPVPKVPESVGGKEREGGVWLTSFSLTTFVLKSASLIRAVPCPSWIAKDWELKGSSKKDSKK